MSKPRFRCSELDRVLSCPASRVVMDAIGGSTSGAVAWDGNLIHYDTNSNLVKEFGATPPQGGLPPPECPIDYKLPAYLEWMPNWLFRHVVDEVPSDWVLEVEPPLEYEFDRWILTGHLDAAATSPDSKESRDFDYKTGRIPVDPASCNEQVGGYLALRRMIYGVEKAKFTILQPFNDEEDGFERVSTIEIDGADKLDNLVAVLDGRVCLAMDNADQLSTGKQCLYCAGLRCAAIRELSRIMKMKLTPEMLANIKREMPDGELVDLVAEVRTLKKPIEDAEDALKDRLEGGKQLAGSDGRVASIKESNGGFNVVDPVGMYSWLNTQLQPAEIAPALSYPSGRIKDALAKGLNIPKSGKKAPMTAETVFAGAAAAYLEPKVKRSLIIA